MMNFLVVIIVVTVALGTLFFMLGYGALFFGAFSRNNKISVIFLILLGFSSVGFVYVGKPWYYALPFWLIPVIYAHLALPRSRNKKRAVISFWLGIILFAGSLGLLGYVASQNADIQASINKFKAQKAAKEKVAESKQKAPKTTTKTTP